MGDWKMVVIKGIPHLYDLSKDLHEDHDVAAEHPEIVQRMTQIIQEEHVDSPRFPVTLPATIQAPEHKATEKVMFYAIKVDVLEGKR